MPRRPENDEDDDDFEAIVIRGKHGREYVAGQRAAEDEDDAPEGHEYDEDGYLRRKVPAKKAAASKKAPAKKGFFDPR